MSGSESEKTLSGDVFDVNNTSVAQAERSVNNSELQPAQQTGTQPNPIESYNEDSLVRTRDRRKVGSGLKGTESKIYQVSTEFTKYVSSVYRYLKSSQRDLTKGRSLDILYDIHDDLGKQMKDVISLYKELTDLDDSSEGKVLEKYKHTYTQLLSNVGLFRDSIDKDIDLFEQQEIQEEQRQAELMQNLDEEISEIDENARLFKQILDKNGGEQQEEILDAPQEDTQPNGISAEDRRLSTQQSGNNLQPTQLEPKPRQGAHRAEIRSQLQQNPMDKLAEVLSSIIKPTSLEPDVFSGDFLLFKDWEVDLDLYLCNERIEGKESLRFLKKFTAGEAKKAIEGHLMSHTDQAYQAARKLLKERYGNEHIIGRSFRDRLTKWPNISNDDSKALLEFSDFLDHLLTAKDSVRTLSVLDDYNENEKMCEKLPSRLKWKWAREVSRVQENDYSYPRFEEFCKFVRLEAKVGLLPLTQGFVSKGKNSDKRQRGPAQSSKATFSTTTERRCLHCKLGNHQAHDCRKLQALDKTDKRAEIRQLQLCYKCVRSGHQYKDCSTKSTCKTCGKSHATVHHDPNFKPRRDSTTSYTSPPAAEDKPQNLQTSTMKSNNNSGAAKGNNISTFATATVSNGLTTMAIPVKISVSSGRSVLVYAVLDNMSDACYISPSILTKLGAKPSAVESNVTIHTMNGPQTTDIERYDNLTITGYMNNNATRISAYMRDINCDKNHLPSPERARRYHHLKGIANEIPPLLDIPVGLLIGMNYTEAIQPLETRTSTKGEPFGAKTLFGWTMCGGRDTTAKMVKNSYLTSADKNIITLLERDFKEVDSTTLVSQNDRKFMEIMANETKLDETGSYIMPLPFKSQPEFPNNRKQAERRFKGLLKRFDTDTNYRMEYNKFMEDLIKAGHAEEAVIKTEPGKVWFMPHFGVRHKRKGKLRVVFDASASYGGASLNNELLSGPDNFNSLLGILLRFRREPIAITCDIEQMFYNFLVDEQHRDYLRFLWMDHEENIKDYRMTKHLFGATSSPSVATYGLRRVADDHQEISHEAANFLRNEFYVDDGVTSVETEEQAVDLIKKAVQICAKANIRLHKFNSNMKSVLSAIPESERSEKIRSIDIFQEQLPKERTLGMEWSLEADSFYFTAPVTSTDAGTKRSVLSKIAQVYDPMGLISPLILKGKLILQRVTASELEWDQLLDPEDMKEWKNWLHDLENLPNLEIKRCTKPREDVQAIELHHFSDASSQGYGACSYIRYSTKDGQPTSKLILSKSRVAPLKKVTTTPRLELQAAVTATRLASILRKELKLNIQKEIFWTDSSIVLGYISNEAKRFHVYVANRVAEIRNSSHPNQWKHVSTKDNPADLASRGCTAEELNTERWLDGPSFLRDKDISQYIKANEVEASLSSNDQEIRKITTLNTTTTTTIANRFSKFSKWSSLVKSVAILRKVITENKKTKIEGKSIKVWRKSILSSDDLLDAEHFIIRSTQLEAFSTMAKENSLGKLNPITDSKGLLRVGGRMTSASWNRPVIIPKHNHIGTLLIRHFHDKIHHMGYRSTLASIRENGYWLISGPTMVKSILTSCIGCRRLKGKPEHQLMGCLPSERLERAAPFTHIGADAFGPFVVKNKRSEVKRWGLIISCAYTRAVHIELLDDMTTDCLIQAFRCFMALRGPIKSLTTDNGTNFVGMKNEVSKESCIDEPKLKAYLEQNKVTFHFNSPTASHQGGATERMIRTARAILNGMRLRFKMVDTTSLRTAFYETANIINSRPLTGTRITDPQDQIMSPNALITGKCIPLVAPPPGEFSSDDVYSRKRWKHSQAIAEEFWKAWKAEYFTILMTRQKWTEKRENVKVGDIVLVKDDSAARCSWQLGRISATHPGKDKLIRKVEITLGNKLIDMSGKPMQPATVLIRPITKVVVLLKA